MSRRKGGRPRAPVPGSRVCAWLTVHEHDRLIAIAIERRQSVSSLVKELLRPWLRVEQSHETSAPH